MSVPVPDVEAIHHHHHHDIEEQALTKEKIHNEQEEPESDPAPDGGVTAWLVAAGAAGIFFCCLGFANSFGTFTEYYLSHQLSDQSPDNVAWIGSISSFLQFFMGMFGGSAFDRYGVKLVRPAAVAYVFSIMMLSLCKTYWQIMLVQGVLMGTVMGFLQFPAMAAVSQFFDKKRAAALGVGISGSSIGGIVIPIAISKMLNGSSLGFGWTVRIIGFLIIPFMAFSVVVLKARLPPRKTTLLIPSAFKDKTYVLLILSTILVFIGMFMPIIFLPTYAVMRGMEPTLAGYLPAILNGASTFGRIIPGILADKHGKLNMYAIGSLVTAIVTFCMNSAESNGAIIAFTAIFGFWSGTLISGAAASITVCVKDPRNMGTYTGMALALAAIGCLVGPPVDGVFVKHYAGFFEATMFSGAMCFAGGLIIVLAKFVSPQGIFSRT